MVRSRVRSLFARAAAIAAIGAVLGLASNALHPMGLPLLLRRVPRPTVPEWVWRRVPHIDAAEGHRRWEARSAIVIDARSSKDYAEGHLPRSLSLPYWEYSAAYPKLAGQLPRNAPILIYCYGSSCGLSMRLAKRLLGEGYQDLTVLGGGIAAWEKAGYPLTAGRTRGDRP